MQLIGVANVGTGFFADACDCLLIEPADFVEHCLGQHAAHLHRTRAALLERSVVEEGVGIGVQDLVRELRRHGRVDCEAADRAAADAVDDAAQTVDVHRFGEDIFHHLLNQRVIGNTDVAFEILGTGRDVGKDRREKIVAADTLNLRRNFLAALKAQQRQRTIGVPAPARGEDGRGQCGLLEDLLDGFRLQVMKDVAEREAVLLGERDVEAVVGGGGLKLEIERAAEAFAQRQPPGLVDAAAKGRVNDELHAAAFVEEALGDDGLLRGNVAEDGAAGDDVLDELFGGGGVEAAFVVEPGDGGLDFGGGIDTAMAQARSGGHNLVAGKIFGCCPGSFEFRIRGNGQRLRVQQQCA